jgi:DNA-binding transcriptional LysR family regulator
MNCWGAVAVRRTEKTNGNWQNHPMDEINEIRLFVRMVAAGSLSETARRLNSSLPAMSRRLAGLEKRLGVRLVDRSTRRFTLTEEGSRYHDRVVKILADLDEAEAEVSAKVASPQGHIRVGAPLEIGRRRFAPLIAEFSKKYPHITIELSLNDAPIDVIGDDLDIGLHLDQQAVDNTISRKIVSSRRVVVASPDYLAKHGTPAKPDDLLAHECICLVRGRHIFDRWIFSEGGKIREVQVRGALMSDHAEIVHGWALMGCGIALKALWDIEDDLETGRLVEVLAPYSASEINLYVFYPSRSHLPQRVRVFIDFLVASMGGPRSVTT